MAFAKNRTLGIRDEYSFRGHGPTAHTLACLRFADLVTETVARLTTGSGGLTPGRADFASAGRHTKFHGVIADPPIPIDQQSLVALYVLSPAAPIGSRLGAVEPSPMQLHAVLCSALQSRQRNYPFFLRLRPKCMIGDLGVVGDEASPEP